jgi:outer membrane protein
MVLWIEKATRRALSDSRCNFVGGVIFVLSAVIPLGASAETIESALARTHVGNPTLTSARASVRTTGENVPRALSGYRSRVTGTADAGLQYGKTHTSRSPDRTGSPLRPRRSASPARP